MIPGVRPALSVLALAFTAYLAMAALLWTTTPEHPWLQIVAVVAFLGTTWICVFWGAAPRFPAVARAGASANALGERSVLPGAAGALALAVAAVLPSVSWIAAGPGARTADYATWSLGAVGALMSIAMVRRRPWVAWSGVVIASVSAMLWIGIPAALALGVVGMVLWVGVAQLMSGLVDGAGRDTARLLQVEREASEWLASQEGARRERRTQIQRALAVAGPLLAHTIAVGGHLDATERALALSAEAALRDELRGTALLDDDVRAAVAAARRRGAAVSLQDEGGLDALTPEERGAVRAEIAAIIADARASRLFVRASSHDDVVVTIVGRSAEGDDDVDLWHEVRRPRTS